MALYKSSVLMLVTLALLLLDLCMVKASNVPDTKEKDPRLKKGLETIFRVMANDKYYFEILDTDYVCTFFNPVWSNIVSDAVMDFYVAVAHDLPFYTSFGIGEMALDVEARKKSPSQILAITFFSLATEEPKKHAEQPFTEKVFKRLKEVFSERQYSEFFAQMFISQGAYETRPSDYKYSDCLALSGLYNIDKVSNFIESENDKALTLKSLIEELVKRNSLTNTHFKTENINVNNNNNDDDENFDVVGQSLVQLCIIDDLLEILPKEESFFKSNPQAILEHFGHLSFNEVDELFLKPASFWINQSYLIVDYENMEKGKLDSSPALKLLELANTCEQLSHSSIFLRDYYNVNIQKNYIQSPIQKRLSGHIEKGKKVMEKDFVKFDCQSFDAFFKFCGEEDLKEYPIQFKPYLVRQIGDIAFDNYQYIKQLRRFQSLDDIALLVVSEKNQLKTIIAERVRDVCDGGELEEYDVPTLKAILIRMIDPIYSKLGHVMACSPSRFISKSGFSQLYHIIEALCVKDDGASLTKVIENSYTLEQRQIIGDYNFRTEKFLLRIITQRIELMSTEEFTMAWARYELTKGSTIDAIKYPIDIDLLFELFDEIAN